MEPQYLALGFIGMLAVTALACWWTYFLMHRPLKGEHDAMEAFKGICDMGAALNQRQGQVLDHFVRIMGDKPWVEVPKIEYIGGDMRDQEQLFHNQKQAWRPENGQQAQQAGVATGLFPPRVEDTLTERAGEM